MAKKEKFNPDILIGSLVLLENDIRDINSLLKQLSESAREIKPWTANEIIHQSGFRLIILKDPGLNRIIGMASLTINKTLMRTVGLIDDVVVDQEYRGMNLGELLVKFAVKVAKVMQAEYVSLTSNPRREAANSLYQKLGFQLMGKVGESNYYRLNL